MVDCFVEKISFLHWMQFATFLILFFLSAIVLLRVRKFANRANLASLSTVFAFVVIDCSVYQILEKLSGICHQWQPLEISLAAFSLHVSVGLFLFFGATMSFYTKAIKLAAVFFGGVIFVLSIYVLLPHFLGCFLQKNTPKIQAPLLETLKDKFRKDEDDFVLLHELDSVVKNGRERFCSEVRRRITGESSIDEKQCTEIYALFRARQRTRDARELRTTGDAIKPNPRTMSTLVDALAAIEADLADKPEEKGDAIYCAIIWDFLASTFHEIGDLKKAKYYGEKIVCMDDVMPDAGYMKTGALYRLSSICDGLGESWEAFRYMAVWNTFYNGHIAREYSLKRERALRVLFWKAIF